MNERIKKLAIQVIGDYSYGDYWPFFEEELEKFTELIVQECAQFIFVLDAEPISHKSAARMLQDHFGIEK
jgi:hypothetical protein